MFCLACSFLPLMQVSMCAVCLSKLIGDENTCCRLGTAHNCVVIWTGQWRTSAPEAIWKWGHNSGAKLNFGSVSDPVSSPFESRRHVVNGGDKNAVGLLTANRHRSGVYGWSRTGNHCGYGPQCEPDCRPLPGSGFGPAADRNTWLCGRLLLSCAKTCVRST
jgi:hypothetical protein